MRGNRAQRCAVAVMAKAPRLGEVKTRLVPPLSAAEAVALSGSFIRDIANNILAASEAAPIDGLRGGVYRAIAAPNPAVAAAPERARRQPL